MAKKFLKPLAAMAASLLVATLQNNPSNAALKTAVEKASDPAPKESSEGRPDRDPITLEQSSDSPTQLDHYSHRSHSSHSSHRSHYSSHYN